MSLPDPPLRFNSCCSAFGYLINNGVVTAQTVRYNSGALIEVKSVIGFRTMMKFLHLRRDQFLGVCPFCGAILQGVVKVTVHEFDVQYSGEAPIRLNQNPKVAEPMNYSWSDLENALSAAAARSNTVRLSWAKRRKQT